MRAYMSTGAGHADDGSRYVCGLNVESAMEEARAILAETEPFEAIAYPASFNSCVSKANQNTAFYALAESLAGFIGTEV